MHILKLVKCHNQVNQVRQDTGVLLLNMDKLLGTQLDRVEIALTTLVDSITSYNPSLTAAQELVFAEDELMLGLEKRRLIILSINV